MCNIVDENTYTVLSTLSGIHLRQLHVIILYNLHKNECPRKQYVGPLNKLEMDISSCENVLFQFIQRALHTASVDT